MKAAESPHHDSVNYKPPSSTTNHTHTHTDNRNKDNPISHRCRCKLFLVCDLHIILEFAIK